MNSEKAAGGLSRGIAGVLDQDETWGGTVTIAANVLVAEGSTLRISAGSRVVFSGTCGIAVLGRLIVAGTEERPASIGGPGPWTGIHAEGRGRVVMRHARLENAGPNLLVSGQGRMDIADCRLTSTRDANVTCRGGFLKTRNCSIVGHSECGIHLRGGRHRIIRARITGARAGLVLEGASASVRDLACSGCPEAVIVRDGSTLELDGAALEGGRMGLSLRASTASIRGVSFRDQAEAGMALARASASVRDLACSGCPEAVVVRDGSTLELDGAAFERGGTGIRVLASKASIANASFRGFSGKALSLRGGDGLRAEPSRLDGLTITDSNEGLALSGAAASVRGLACSGCPEAVVVRDGSTLDLEGAALKEGRTGLIVLASEASVRNASFSDYSETGLSMHGGSVVRAGSCRVSKCRVGMRLAEERGDFTELSIDACRDLGVYAPLGRHRFLRYSGPTIAVEEPARVELDGRPLLAEAPDWSRESSGILRLVLRTGDIRPFRALYHGLYRLGEAAFRGMTRMRGNVVSCDAWRGWMRGDWIPGVSDLDFVVAARALSGEQGRRWLLGFWRRHARLKRAMPFLGETVVVLESELQDYLEFGGARARELAAATRRKAPVLAGEPKRQLALWAECASSYVRLTEWLWHRNRYPWAFRRAQLFKSAVDILRHLPSTGSGPSPVHPSRKTFWDGIRGTPFAGSRAVLQGLLDDGSIDGPPEALLSGLWAHLLAVMHRSAIETETPWNAPGDREADIRYASPRRTAAADGRGASPERWRPQIEKLQAHFGERLSGALFSDLYPSHAILRDEGFSEAWLHESRWSPSGPSGGQTIILSRRLWHIWSRLPVSEDPVLFMDAATSAAGRLVPMRGQYSWGETSAPAPPPGILLESARQSLAQFRLIRRWLGSPAAALNSRCCLHYLLSRAMGLRLLTERRVAAPFFDLDHLADVYGREFHDSAGELSRIDPEAGQRSVDEAYWACHDLLESALRCPIR